MYSKVLSNCSFLLKKLSCLLQESACGNTINQIKLTHVHNKHDIYKKKHIYNGKREQLKENNLYIYIYFMVMYYYLFVSLFFIPIHCDKGNILIIHKPYLLRI